MGESSSKNQSVTDWTAALKAEPKSTAPLSQEVPKPLSEKYPGLKAVIVIEGEIGAGKSTLAPLIADAFRKKGLVVAVALEPVDKWIKNGILASFKKDPERYTYEFQTYTFVTRIQEVVKAMKDTPDADILIVERTIHTDRWVFMELQRKTVGPASMARYEDWCGMFSQLMPVDLAKAHYVYLKPSLGHCMERVEKRGRAEELVDAASTPPATDSKFVPAKGGVTMMYQKSLREAHESLFEGKHSEKYKIAERPFPLSKVLVIDGEAADDDFSKAGAARDKIIQQISAFTLCPYVA